MNGFFIRIEYCKRRTIRYLRKEGGKNNSSTALSLTHNSCKTKRQTNSAIGWQKKKSCSVLSRENILRRKKCQPSTPQISNGPSLREDCTKPAIDKLSSSQMKVSVFNEVDSYQVAKRNFNKTKIEFKRSLKLKGNVPFISFSSVEKQ